jgi:hypothetical protein
MDVKRTPASRVGEPPAQLPAGHQRLGPGARRALSGPGLPSSAPLSSTARGHPPHTRKSPAMTALPVLLRPARAGARTHPGGSLDSARRPPVPSGTIGGSCQVPSERARPERAPAHPARAGQPRCAGSQSVTQRGETPPSAHGWRRTALQPPAPCAGAERAVPGASRISRPTARPTGYPRLSPTVSSRPWLAAMATVMSAVSPGTGTPPDSAATRRTGPGSRSHPRCWGSGVGRWRAAPQRLQ